MALKVNEQSAQVVAMARHWPIVEDLLGGTDSMRQASTRRLPKWPNEDPASYDTRLATATLFPAFARTLGVMSGKPFAKALTYADDVPTQIREWCDDVDLEGRNLHTFASELLDETLAFGIAGVLVDFPRLEGVKTQADERRIGARPYMVKVNHGQVLGWRARRVNGGMKLTQLRLAETAEADDGEYGVVTVERVRVLRPGSWELWQKGKQGYVLIDSGETSLPEIPFVPFYGRRTGFMTGISPLLNLAHLNVKHWQSQSDQDTILHVARVPILFMKGFPSDQAVTVGGSAAVKAEQTDADMKYVEHTGAAIDAGRQSLRDLEDQMIQTGAELLVQTPGQRSATEANNDAEANKSELQRIVEGFEDSLDQCLQFMARWVNLEQGGHVSLFKDFGSATLTDASAQLILSMQQSGLITKETAIREQQRRGMLAPDIDPLDELERVTDEGPELGMIGNGDQ